MANEAYSERSLGWWAWKLGSEGEALDNKPKAAKRPRRSNSQPFELVEFVTQPAPAPAPAPAPLTMRVGAVEVLVNRGFDRDVLEGVLDVLEARR